MAGEAEAIVAGATVKTSSAAPVPIATLKSEVNLMVTPWSSIPGMHPLVFYPRAETALVTPACNTSDTGRPRLGRFARDAPALEPNAWHNLLFVRCETPVESRRTFEADGDRRP